MAVLKSFFVLRSKIKTVCDSSVINALDCDALTRGCLVTGGGDSQLVYFTMNAILNIAKLKDESFNEKYFRLMKKFYTRAIDL